MKFPELDIQYTFTADLKMVNLSVGLSSCNCIHSCPYCEGAKFAYNKQGIWKETNKFGQYFPGNTRTLGSIKLNNRRFIVHGKGLNAPKYKNCVRSIVGLWGEDMDHVKTNVCLSVHHENPSASQKHAYQPNLSHHANQPSCQSAIMPPPLSASQNHNYRPAFATLKPFRLVFLEH